MEEILAVLQPYLQDLREYPDRMEARCPFHEDGGRPNLVIWPHIGGFKCFRCGASGKLPKLLQALGAEPAKPLPPPPPRQPRERPARVVRAITEADRLYRHRLLGEARVLGYLASRGVSLELALRTGVGYASGRDLLYWLRYRRVPVDDALEAGLLQELDGKLLETMRGRITFPATRGEETLFLLGRAWACTGWRRGQPARERHAPKYRGLRGPRVALGIHDLDPDRPVWVVEGPFDRLALMARGHQAVALGGTHPSRETLSALRRLPDVRILLDADAAGREAARALARALPHARVEALPDGVTDPAELVGQIT